MASTPANGGATPQDAPVTQVLGTVAAPAGAITGLNGYIAMLNGASAMAMAAPCEEIPGPPGGSSPVGGVGVIPPHSLYRVTDRTRKIGDSLVKPVVYVGGTNVVPATAYQYMPGGQYILFYTPRAAADTITADVGYISTSQQGDVYGLVHVLNWQLNMTANAIQGDEYGTQIIPQYRGKMSGTWQFERYSSSTGYDLYYMMMLKSHFVFALYESLQQSRMWIVYGDIGANPLNASTNAMIGGTITGTMDAMPSNIIEAL